MLNIHESYNKIRSDARRLLGLLEMTTLSGETRRVFREPILDVLSEIRQIRPGLYHNYKRIRLKMEDLRKKLERSVLHPDIRREFYTPLDHILHECRIMTEEITGGFWYDPVAVRSRKVTGG